eukprot:gene12503-biopygen573
MASATSIIWKGAAVACEIAAVTHEIAAVTREIAAVTREIGIPPYIKLLPRALCSTMYAAMHLSALGIGSGISITHPGKGVSAELLPIRRGSGREYPHDRTGSGINIAP